MAVRECISREHLTLKLKLVLDLCEAECRLKIQFNIELNFLLIKGNVFELPTGYMF